MTQNDFGAVVEALIKEVVDRYGIDFNPELFGPPPKKEHLYQPYFQNEYISPLYPEDKKSYNKIFQKDFSLFKKLENYLEPQEPLPASFELGLYHKHLAPKKQTASIFDIKDIYDIKPTSNSPILDFNQEPEELPLKALEDCTRYKQAISDAPTVIPVSDLERIAGTMYAMNYSMALREMGEIVTSKSDRLTRDKRNRIEKLLETAKTLGEHPTLSPLFSQEIDSTYGIRIVQPDGAHEELRRDLGKVKLCWISESTANDPDNVSKARWLQRDTDIGACVQLIGEDHNIPITYTRNYVVETREGERALFLDTIESGNVTWYSPEEWIKNNRGKELLYHLAATIYSAEVLGLKKIGIGEREIQDIATAFGFREESLFDSSQSYRKLGIQPLGRSGPTTFQLYSSQTRRVINLDEIKPPSLTELEDRIARVSKFVDARAKQMKKDSNKREEVMMYLEAIEGINHRIYRNADLLVNLHSLREKITPNLPQQ